MERSTSPMRHLDLNNYDKALEDGNKYDLTTPQSLKSSARLGIKPVELLIKSLNEFIDACRHDTQFEAVPVEVLHDTFEKERRRLLMLCQEERQEIIQVAGIRTSGTDKSVSPEAATKIEKKVSDHTSEETSCQVVGIKGADSNVDVGIIRKSASSVGSSSYAHSRQDKKMVSSYGLGDFRHSPATEKQLERLTSEIKKEMSVTVPAKDRKIAALMLVKYEEEQDRLRLSQQEKEEREEVRSREQAWRAQAEKRRRKELECSMQHWQEKVEACRMQKERRVSMLAVQHKQDVMLQEDRWRRLTEEKEAQRKKKTDATRKEAEERKRNQEKLFKEKEKMKQIEREKERQLAEKKEQYAQKSKVGLKRQEGKRLQQVNQKDLLHHLLLKRKMEQQAEAAQALLRESLEQKLHNSFKKRAQAMEARLRDLKDRAVREEEQIRTAQVRAKQQSHEQLRQKQVLVQLSQQRTEQAALHTLAQCRNRALQARQDNQKRQSCHHKLQEKVKWEEEGERVVRQRCIMMKEHRTDRLQKKREQVREEARKVARASFKMRERVREQTQSRSFNQMAVEAELSASLGRIKLFND